MKSTLSDQIQEYCEEALVITDKYGPQEGLSYLVGKKFCRVLRSLREAQNKTKFLYADDIHSFEENSLKSEEQRQEQRYAPDLKNNYKELQEEIRSLQSLSDEFIREIKDCFERQDIEDYLNSYPRLGSHREEQGVDGPAESSDTVRLDKADIFSEVQDIFLVEEIKKLFN